MAHQQPTSPSSHPSPNATVPVAKSPGSMSPLERQQDIVARLVCDTDQEVVKKVLRLYKPQDTLKRQKNAVTKANASELVQTLEYLGVQNAKDNYKSTNIELFILRIQALFPDSCRMCNENYALHRTENPLLRCAKCDQGVHARCLAQKLGVPEVDLETMTTEEVTKKINPLGINTMPYLCGYCFDELIPDSNNVDKSRSKPKPKQMQLLTETTEKTTQSDSEIETEPDPPPVQNDRTDEEDADDEADRESVHHNPPPKTPNRNSAKSQTKSRPERKNLDAQPGPKPICSFYRRGACNHGISGKGCSRAHPKMCQKLMTFGDKGSRGCRKGSNCDKFHPKMCPSSILHRECLTDSCTLYHVKGTRRSNSRPNDQTHYRHQQQKQDSAYNRSSEQRISHDHATTNGPTTSPQQAFLEALNSWTKQFMTTLDQRLHTGSQIQPHSHHVSNPQPMQTTVLPQAVLLPQAQLFQQGQQGPPRI